MHRLFFWFLRAGRGKRAGPTGIQSEGRANLGGRRVFESLWPHLFYQTGDAPWELHRQECTTAVTCWACSLLRI